MTIRNTDSFCTWYRRRRIIVTGGLGFIGSTLCHALVERGAEVWIYDNELPGSGANKFNISGLEHSIAFTNIDIANTIDQQDIIQSADCIFNLSGYTDHMQASKNPEKDYWANALSHYKFLQICAESKFKGLIVYTGSRSQYGRTSQTLIHEDDPQVPIDLHGAHKMMGEIYHSLARSMFGLQSVIVRLANTYGPRQPLLPKQVGLVAQFLNSAFEDGEIEIFGTGKRFRELVFVDDVVDLLLKIGCRKDCTGLVFNGGGFPCNLDTLANIIIHQCKKGKILFKEFPESIKNIEVGDVQLDLSRARDTFGWEPTTKPEDGLVRTVEYFQRHMKEYRKQ